MSTLYYRTVRPVLILYQAEQVPIILLLPPAKCFRLAVAERLIRLFGMSMPRGLVGNITRRRVSTLFRYLTHNQAA
jgi:hypothetical protein